MTHLPTCTEIERLMLDVETLRAQLAQKCKELREAIDCVMEAEQPAAAPAMTLRPAKDRRKQA
jgi:hypothetical protein